MKKEPMGNERERNGWLGASLRQTPAVATDVCLDPETLAAWADGALSVKAAAAVELHASSCSRCMAVIAAMERSAPAPAVSRAWTPARVFRWLAPLTAAATAVAIWIVVPDRPITQVEPAPSHTLAMPEPGTRNPEPGTANLEPGTRNPEPQTLEPQRQSAPSARIEKPAAEEQVQMRDELSRERAAPERFGATAAAPHAAAPPAVSTDKAADMTVSMAQRLESAAQTVDSVSPTNSLIHWRIVASAAIERSTDGGKTWTRTNVPATSTVAIRTVDGDRAVARTSDGAEFYTTNGGLTWIRVQEKSAAPF